MMRTEDKVINAIVAYHDAQLHLAQVRRVIQEARIRVQESQRELARQIKNFTGRNMPVWYAGVEYMAKEAADGSLTLVIGECPMRILGATKAQDEWRADVTAKKASASGD
jgi:hypothetical protein